MDDVVGGVLAFIRWAETNPLPPDVPTRAVLSTLRGQLDAAAPGWRVRAFHEADGAAGVEVEVHLRGGRVVRGTLAQQPSPVRGKAA
jgi:hypothetical protein